MNTGLISSRYALTLLNFSIENGEQEEVYDRMKFLSDVFLQTKVLRGALNNRSITNSNKKKLLVTACGGNLPVSLDKMLDLILKNEREEVLHFITLQYIKLYREKFNIQSAKLTTAYSMSDEETVRFLSRIENIVNENIELETETDPDIIGGFILQLGDYRWDASMSGKLARLKNTINEGVEISKLD